MKGGVTKMQTRGARGANDTSCGYGRYVETFVTTCTHSGKPPNALSEVLVTRFHN